MLSLLQAEREIIPKIVEKNLPSIRKMFDNKVHLGHKSSLRHLDATQMLFGTRPNDSHRDLGRNLDVIDLNQTRLLLNDSLHFIAHLVMR